jgi:hypothetical protein
MPSLLQEQLDLYNRQTQNWPVHSGDEAHNRLVQERKRLYELLTFGLFLYDQIRKIDDEWGGDVLSPQTGGTAVESAFEIGRLYRWWCEPCEFILHELATLEAKGYPLQIADKFRLVCAEARTKVDWNPVRIERAEAQFASGGGRKADEVFDELRRSSARSSN